MRAQRVKTGFHRIGIILAAIPGALGILGIAASIPAYLGWFPKQVEMLWTEPLGFGVGALLFAALCYTLAWAVGWVISGFAGEA